MLTIASHSECGQFIFTHCNVSLTWQTLRDHQHVWPNIFESTSYDTSEFQLYHGQVAKGRREFVLVCGQMVGFHAVLVVFSILARQAFLLLTDQLPPENNCSNSVVNIFEFAKTFHRFEWKGWRQLQQAESLPTKLIAPPLSSNSHRQSRQRGKCFTIHVPVLWNT